MSASEMLPLPAAPLRSTHCRMPPIMQHTPVPKLLGSFLTPTILIAQRTTKPHALTNPVGSKAATVTSGNRQVLPPATASPNTSIHAGTRTQKRRPGAGSRSHPGSEPQSIELPGLTPASSSSFLLLPIRLLEP